MKFRTIEASVKKETEKAVLMDCTIDTFSKGLTGTTVWFPKSQVKIKSENELEVAAWLLPKKLDEVKQFNRDCISFIEFTA